MTGRGVWIYVVRPVLFVVGIVWFTFLIRGCA